jgi:hypothetical protein
MAMDLDAIQAIADKYPHVSPQWLPSPNRHAQWEAWVLWADGCDDNGNFLGHCPLHDPMRKREGSAEFNFFKGVMRCQGDPRCDTRKDKHENNGKVPRAMSLTVVGQRMADAAQ